MQQAHNRHVLPAVRVPTLVLHRAGDKAMRVEGGHYLAQHLQSAKYVELDGDDHWWWVGDTEAILVEIELFLRDITEPELPDRMLATILFVEMIDENGVEARERAYRSLVRGEVERFRGRSTLPSAPACIPANVNLSTANYAASPSRLPPTCWKRPLPAKSCCRGR